MKVEHLYTFGSDALIVEAARTTRGAHGERSANRRLIRYLWRKGHHTPFEFPAMIFRVRAPRAILQQWLRHRASVANMESQRYAEPDFSDVYAADGHAADRAVEVYHREIANGTSRELARFNLPLGVQATMIWKSNLRHLFNFLGQRTAPDAQAEIRALAWEVARHVEAAFPLAFEAWADYSRDAVTLSRAQVHALVTGDVGDLGRAEAREVEAWRREI